MSAISQETPAATFATIAVHQTCNTTIPSRLIMFDLRDMG